MKSFLTVLALTLVIVPSNALATLDHTLSFEEEEGCISLCLGLLPQEVLNTFNGEEGPYSLKLHAVIFYGEDDDFSVSDVPQEQTLPPLESAGISIFRANNLHLASPTLPRFLEGVSEDLKAQALIIQNAAPLKQWLWDNERISGFALTLSPQQDQQTPPFRGLFERLESAPHYSGLVPW